MRSLLTTFCAALLALTWGSPGSASITYEADGVLGLGLLSASVEFTAVNGGIEITVTNTESDTQFKDQAISSLSFQVGDGLGTPTGFTELSGRSYDPKYSGWLIKTIHWTSTSGTGFDNKWTGKGSDAIDHWGLNVKAKDSSVQLATADNHGMANYMILPSSGTAYWPITDLAGKNSPYIIGPATFFLSVAGVTEYTNLTASNIKDVQVGFGIGPSLTLDAKVSSVTPLADPPAVPEPSTLAIAGLGALGLIGYGLRRHRTK
ncbi:MAG: PEP-CTERM sorting domain-containing protein [Isosphaeraceae bacterium]